MNRKYYSLEKVMCDLEKIKVSRRIVFMSGVFDLFHYGHYKALLKASKMGDIFIVQVDGNRLVRDRKGDGRPYIDQKLRASMVLSLRFVDYVFISNRPSEDEETLKILKPSIYIRAIKARESYGTRKKREIEINKKLIVGKVVWLKRTTEISTTKVMGILRVENKRRSVKCSPKYRASNCLYYQGGNRNM